MMVYLGLIMAKRKAHTWEVRFKQDFLEHQTVRSGSMDLFLTVIKMVFGKLTKFVLLRLVLPKQVMGKFGPMGMVEQIGMMGRGGLRQKHRRLVGVFGHFMRAKTVNIG